MPEGLKQFLQRWVICTAAVLLAEHLVSGITYDHWTDVLAATLLLSILNSVVTPLLWLLSLPLLILSLGLFTLVINAGMLLVVGALVKGFHVAGFWPAFWGALVISLTTLVLNALTGAGSARVRVQTGRSRPRRHSRENRPPGGDGPVIDV